jgi:hypothetical protein
MDETLLEAGFFDEIDKWRAANQDSGYKEYKNSMVSDADYDKLKDAIETIETEEDYKEYKKAFDRICYFCHVMSRGVIFAKYELKKGKQDKNSFYLKYTYNTKRMTLPEGSQLYHISKVGGITELMPFFRGKSERGYKYDKPRIYLTIRKNMPKLMADYGATKKTHTYLVKEPIRQVFVDPMLWGYVSGAVYIETNKPIKVEEITDRDKAAEIKEKNDNAFKEEALLEEVEGEIPFDTDHFFSFISENGLIIESVE